MVKNKIKSIKAREILDSRGNPTLEVEVQTPSGVFLASVPSGASKGKHEALELRDNEERYGGKGVLRAVENINKKIAPLLIGRESTKQEEIDQLMINLDGTKKKEKLGANAICGVSLAACRAGAAGSNLSPWSYINKIFNFKFALYDLPKPCFNLINGGAHAGNDLDFQEFMVVPQENYFSENLRVAAETYHSLKEIIFKKYGKGATNLGDEGGFAPPLKAPEEAIELVMAAAQKLNYKIKIIIDVAASQFFKAGKYKTYKGVFKGDVLADYYFDLIKKYPILGLEDPFAEDDWESWTIFKSKIKSKKSKILIIGDDLLVTNPERIKLAEKKEAVNAMILKINQIGTVWEALEAARLAKEFGFKTVVSHRSGETNDDFISDFALGIGADFIKSGAPARGERLAKYNRLLKIEKEFKPR